MKKINIGILGYGVVGSGTYKVLSKNIERINKEHNIELKIYGIASKSLDKNNKYDFDEDILITNDVFELVNNDNIDIIVELMGGTTTAYDAVKQSINNKKHIVTANKKLIAEHGNEIFLLASKNKVIVMFEAAVAGGIPIIKIITEGLIANKIKQVNGIINGTCNFILTKMKNDCIGFDEALNIAKKLGYAEADPTFDIEGIDSAHKLTILSSLAFNTKLHFDQCYIEGITKIKQEDIEYAKELGYKIKLLGITKLKDQKIELRVHPCLTPNQFLISHVNDVMNAVFVESDILGRSLYYGAGAGSFPTASAVVADIINISKNIAFYNDNEKYFYYLNESSNNNNLKVMPIEEIRSSYYLRLEVNDEKGVLAMISSIFPQYDVSIEALIQRSSNVEEKTNIVILTHSTKEKLINKIINKLNEFDFLTNIHMIRVETFQ